MSQFGLVDQFVQLTRNVQSETELFRLMEEITPEIGFRHFALINHIDLKRSARNAIGIYNYPESWVEHFTKCGLCADDPVLLASLTSLVGFVWTDVPTMISMTSKQQRIFDDAAKHGLGVGFTVPAHVPGEMSGSCSFAARPGVQIPTRNLLLAQLIGLFAYQAARRLSHGVTIQTERSPRLTPRQRECLIWAIKGKTDWEIGQILDLNEHTVSRHLDMARERYGVAKRLPLAIHAIFEGQISFIEALF